MRFIVIEMFITKNDYKELDKNWVIGFFKRYEELQSRFSQSLNKERVIIHNAEKLLRWFQLVETIIQKHDIQQADIYNIDKKGFALGMTDKARVICFRNNLHIYIIQNDNKEWASFIEYISDNGRFFDMFVIFKNKRQMGV